MQKYRLLLNLSLWSLVVMTAMILAMIGMELKPIDRFMIELVKREAAVLKNDIYPAISNPHKNTLSFNNNLNALLTKRSSLKNNHFISAEIYNTKKELLAEIEGKDVDLVINKIHSVAHDFPDIGEVWNRKIIIGNQLYVQAMVPLIGKNLETIGYFEGVFHVSRNTLIEIAQRLAFQALLLILIVLATTLVLYPTILRQERRLVRHANDLMMANLAMLKVLGNSIAKRDSDTDAHNYRVTLYSLKLAQQLNFDVVEIQQLVKGAFLHDVGKIGISDNILLKPGKLDSEEFAEMKKHVNHGIDIIKDTSWLMGAHDVIQSHHEKFNGTGYPDGLKGDEIPLGARLFAIVDVFDALTSERPYKLSIPLERVKCILRKEAGIHFDPVLLHVFLGMADSYYADVYEVPQDELENILDNKIRSLFSL